MGRNSLSAHPCWFLLPSSWQLCKVDSVHHLSLTTEAPEAREARSLTRSQVVQLEPLSRLEHGGLWRPCASEAARPVLPWQTCWSISAYHFEGVSGAMQQSGKFEELVTWAFMLRLYNTCTQIWSVRTLHSNRCIHIQTGQSTFENQKPGLWLLSFTYPPAVTVCVFSALIAILLKFCFLAELKIIPGQMVGECIINSPQE